MYLDFFKFELHMEHFIKGSLEFLHVFTHFGQMYHLSFVLFLYLSFSERTIEPQKRDSIAKNKKNLILRVESDKVKVKQQKWMYIHKMNIHFRRKAEFLITILITIQKGIGVIGRERQRRSKKLGLKKVMKNTRFPKKTGYFSGRG